MSIQNILSKINSCLGDGGVEVLTVVSIVLAGVLGSGITYIAMNGAGPHSDPVFTTFDQGTVKTSQTAGAMVPATKPASNTGTVYASKNGKKYYYPNCSGLNRIKEENKISFATADEAESEGYTLASGCN